jgi:peptidoglycan hydrolase-like protein with peptidoglycan-binding domain
MSAWGATKKPAKRSPAKSSAHKKSSAKAAASKTPHKKSTRRVSSRGRRRESYRARLARQKLQPQRIEEIQQGLIQAGYLNEEPTGKWDNSTREAMRAFQHANGFPETRPRASSSPRGPRSHRTSERQPAIPFQARRIVHHRRRRRSLAFPKLTRTLGSSGYGLGSAPSGVAMWRLSAEFAGRSVSVLRRKLGEGFVVDVTNPVLFSLALGVFFLVRRLTTCL